MDRQISMTVSDPVWDALRKEAETTGRDVSDMARIIVMEWAMRNEIFRALSAGKA